MWLINVSNIKGTTWYSTWPAVVLPPHYGQQGQVARHLPHNQHRVVVEADAAVEALVEAGRHCVQGLLCFLLHGEAVFATPGYKTLSNI